jgi:hypothetical protein
MSFDQCIIKKCEESWEEEFVVRTKNKDNCSGFVKAVAKKLNVPLPPAQADGILETVKMSWTKLNSGAEAANKAAAGFFVLAGLRSGDHTKTVSQGHVVIVINGPLYRNKYPTCWGGSTGSAQSKGNKTVGEVWSPTDRDKVTYHMHKYKVCAG